jgi:hypothetical protein
MIVQGFGYKQINVFFTVPKLFFIDKQARSLAHIRFQSRATQGIMKMFRIKENKFNPKGYIEPSPSVIYGGQEITTKTVKFKLPSKDLAEKYEAKKQAFMDAKFKAFEEELKEAQEKSKKTESMDWKAVALKLKTQGMSINEIADILDKSHTTVQTALSKERK